jgi:DNA-binding NtrC family response regulator
VLEEKKLFRVGGVDTVDIDVRVIAATNRDLKSAIEQGSFREDLYYRLNVFPIELPGLAARRDDIVELAEHFLIQSNYSHPSLTTPVRDLLLRYDWPGNIRELKNVIERATILAGGEPLSVEDFSLEVDDAPLVDTGSAGVSAAEGLETAEKIMILNALDQAGGNKTEAARLLKISRRRLYSRMKVHEIKPRSARSGSSECTGWYILRASPSNRILRIGRMSTGNTELARPTGSRQPRHTV